MAESPTVLVVGAAGQHAGLIVPLLAQRGVFVRGLVRNEERGAQALAHGAAEYAIGDLRDMAGLMPALRDVSGVYYIAPVYPGDESERIGRAFVQAAAEAGVRRFVFSSVIHPMITALDNHIQKIPVEEAVVDSGMEFTILRPCHFYQNINRAWRTVTEKHVFAEPFSAERRLSWVDYRDVAEIGAIALTEDRLRNGTFDCCADYGYSRHDVVRIMSQALGETVVAVESDPQEWVARLPIPDPYTKGALSRMYTYYDRHGLVGNPTVLKAILGREPRSLHQFLCDLIAGTPTVAHPWPNEGRPAASTGPG